MIFNLNDKDLGFLKSLLETHESNIDSLINLRKILEERPCFNVDNTLKGSQ